MIPVTVAILFFATDGATKAFNLTGEDGALYFYLPSDLHAAFVSADQTTQFQLHYNDDFSIAGDGRAGTGVLTTTADDALPAGVLAIWRNTNVIQPENYHEGDNFPAGTHNNAQDRGRLIDQDVLRIAEQAYAAPNYEPAPRPVPRLALRKDFLAKFDPASGDLTITSFTESALLARLAAIEGGGGGGVTPARTPRFLSGDIAPTFEIFATDHLDTIFVDGAHGAFDILFDDGPTLAGVQVTIKRKDSAPNGNAITVNGGATAELDANGNLVVLKSANSAIEILWKA